ncbi:hypothetical protein KC19_VG326600 [Ceratodon purpureus]|uniref:Uncharacterized protein n=1 Tax=Ceratodon purpureus TaxID=3225 RepID=A0A8T0HXK6_CERPU|nr:hypothetical protein KC19_VG326600 [Ceratodon purpureus]
MRMPCGVAHSDHLSSSFHAPSTLGELRTPPNAHMVVKEIRHWDADHVHEEWQPAPLLFLYSYPDAPIISSHLLCDKGLAVPLHLQLRLLQLPQLPLVSQLVIMMQIKLLDFPRNALLRLGRECCLLSVRPGYDRARQQVLQIWTEQPGWRPPTPPSPPFAAHRDLRRLHPHTKPTQKMSASSPTVSLALNCTAPYVAETLPASCPSTYKLRNTSTGP